MRYYILGFFFLFPILLFAQNIPKGTNAIIVKGVIFENVINNILDQGFQIDEIDKDFHTAKTKFKKTNNKEYPYTLQLSFYIRVKDSSAIIIGEYILGENYVKEEGLYRAKIENIGPQKNWNEKYQAFLEMVKITESLTGISIDYKKQ